MLHEQFDSLFTGSNALVINPIVLADILGAHEGKGTK